MHWTWPSRILVVDDSEEQTRLLRRILTDAGLECILAADARQADESLSNAVDVVLLDVELPDHDGVSICRRIRTSADMALMPVPMMTGRLDQQVMLDALSAGADDFLVKPLRVPELMARVGSAVRTEPIIDTLDSAAASIMILAAAIEARDRHTSGHCQRLAKYGVDLGSRIGLDRADVEALQYGGYLHDLGKVAVPDSVLFKPSRLTSAEFTLVKSHPVVGDRICAPLRSLERVRPIIRHHHELLDGSGYPDGLRGAAVPLLAQVMSIVDAYDALTTDRPYRCALESSVAFELLWNEAALGRRDTSLVSEFSDLIKTAWVSNAPTRVAAYQLGTTDGQAMEAGQ